MGVLGRAQPSKPALQVTGPEQPCLFWGVMSSSLPRMHPLPTRYKAVVHYNYFCKSLRRVAATYNVSKSSVQRWVKSTSTQDMHLSRPLKRCRKVVSRQIQECVTNTLTSSPFTTMASLARVVSRTCNVKMSPSTVSRIRKKLNWTRKKTFRCVDHAHQPEKVIGFCKQFLDANTYGEVISIDEAGFYVGDNPRFGYSPRGQRLQVNSSRTLRRRKLTLLMAITKAGVHHFQVLDVNCTKTHFVRFIQDMPAIPGASLLMDNVAISSLGRCERCHRISRNDTSVQPSVLPKTQPDRVRFQLHQVRLPFTLSD